MKRSLSAPPDAFSISPFLCLVPARSSISSLAALEPALYARLETVQQLSEEGADPQVRAEQAMLQQIFEYLAQPKPEEL